MKDDKRLKRKVRNSYAVSTLSIALVLFLLGSVGYLIATALDASRSLSEEISATVELKRDIDTEMRDKIRQKIAANPISGEITFSSKEDKIADEEFRKMFGVEFESVLIENPLMDSFDVKLSSQAGDSEMLKIFMAEIQSIEGVDRVSYPAQLIETVHDMLRKFQLVVFIFGGALLLISLILLNNTIRLAIYSRRYLINTMKLVGATKWFIIAPFLGRGLLCGLWAGLLASLLFGGAFYALTESIPELFSMAELYRAGVVAGSMTVCGVTISGLFTLFAVNKFVNMKSNKIHIY